MFPDIWTEDLKKSIIRAVLYYRLIELELDVWAIESIDLLDINWDSLDSFLNIFFQARDIDLDRPTDTASSFRKDLSIFMAAIEQPRNIFLGSAKESAISIVGRVGHAYGLCAHSGSFEDWENAVRAIDPYRTGQAMRALAYQSLFDNAWGEDTLMDTMWGAGMFIDPRTLMPHEFFRDANEWGDHFNFL